MNEIDLRLKTWLEKNDPQVLEKAEALMESTPDYDLQDAVDEVDSTVYQEWSSADYPEQVFYDENVNPVKTVKGQVNIWGQKPLLNLKNIS